MGSTLALRAADAECGLACLAQLADLPDHGFGAGRTSRSLPLESGPRLLAREISPKLKDPGLCRP